MCFSGSSVLVEDVVPITLPCIIAARPDQKRKRGSRPDFHDPAPWGLSYPL